MFSCKSIAKILDYRLALAEALSLSSPLQKDSIADWSWPEVLSPTNPLPKGMIWRLELIVKIHYEVIADCSWSEALSFTNPLRKDLITGWSCPEALSLTNPL